ncbi:hypothetical protein QBC34DRAFT_374910 [Podospora aff. communis PSN243]|jgi:hypothetical protein|uniref:Uncharacterized protein n=1 Tax=Podospora aff. communis PSN243 TaxID=3040156 RepID=A0AAV9H402_9PEZI|nr:hypothetical protein QBC34DRAFT_374910 [Podospora aff. communis PSN243]
MAAEHVQVQGSRSVSSAKATRPKKSAVDLPAWAQDALALDAREQPWKAQFGQQQDDPNFHKEKDTCLFYNSQNKVCLGEGSMAA